YFVETHNRFEDVCLEYRVFILCHGKVNRFVNIVFVCSEIIFTMEAGIHHMSKPDNSFTERRKKSHENLQWGAHGFRKCYTVEVCIGFGEHLAKQDKHETDTAHTHQKLDEVAPLV